MIWKNLRRNRLGCLADLGQTQLHQTGGIEVRSLPTNRDMQVRPGCPAGAAAQANFLAAVDVVAFLYLEDGKV